MIVQFQDFVTGTPVYINPAFVATVRPDPEDPERTTDVKLRDGENVPGHRRSSRSGQQAFQLGAVTS